MSDLRNLPKVDALARSAALNAYPERVRTEASRRAVAAMRERAVAGDPINQTEGSRLAVLEAGRLMLPSLRPAINLSGVILHTGLGRARLADEAGRRLAEVASGHSAVELDIQSGKRGDRQRHVRDLLVQLTGAEDALVVNNAAAAVLLSLTALCQGREVILSRGQMVEIGGSFRMPDIVRASGCRLVEVGCTNKTRLSDYDDAITSDTAAILRCHPSNFKIVGFTEEPSAADLAELAHSHNLLLLDDVGAGCLVDIMNQPTLQDSIKAGADAVMASGDKLLGGPQAGILLGKTEAIAQAKRHPLARALRVDKLTLAALEATLRLYATGRESQIPTVRYLTRPVDELKSMAHRLAKAYSGKARIEQGLTEVGGGSLPGEGIPTWRAGLEIEDPDGLAASLRAFDTPIVGRIEDGMLWLDPRTAEPEEIEIVERMLKGLAKA